jgi:glycolate oxidase iron-sulfur subunit
VLFGILTSPVRLRLGRGLLLVYQRSGLQAVFRRSGVLKMLPRRVQVLDALAPPPAPRESVAELTPAAGERRRRVGLVTGCVQSAFLSPVNAATARILATAGCEVVAPPGQPCCGALLMHAGEEARALDHARRMIATFEQANVETIVSNAGGCGSNLKEYGYQLRDDLAYAERAARFAAKCRDVAEVLAEFRPTGVQQATPLRVAYHDSCHLQHAQGVCAQPRQLLSNVPGVQLLEIPEGAICCGSAGIYNLVQPDTAADLGRRKAELIAALRPDVVATGNPGCILQLQSALSALGHSIPVVHTVQVLDPSSRAALVTGPRARR